MDLACPHCEVVADERPLLRTEPRQYVKRSSSDVSGSASVVMTGQLRSLEDGGTEADVVAEVDMAGRLVQVGSRLIQFVSDQLFDQLVDRLRDRLESPGEEAEREG